MSLKYRDPETGAWVPIGISPINITDPVTDEKYFDIDDDGMISLKPEYRGHCSKSEYHYSVSDNGIKVNGTKNHELPKNIVIPENVNEITVTALAPAMFAWNDAVKTITVPACITEIPEAFCYGSLGIKEVKGTENVKVLGGSAFRQTTLLEANFPALERLDGTHHFSNAVLLTIADLGSEITALPQDIFAYAEHLSCLRNAENVTSVGERAFYRTRRIMNPAFLPKLTSIGKEAFSLSRVNYDWASLTSCTFGELATSLQLNPTDYSGCTYTPCKTPVRSTFNQRNPEWADVEIGSTGRKYSAGCVMVSAAMIYSALMGVDLSSPVEYEELVKAANPDLLTVSSADFENQKQYLEAVGLSAEYREGMTPENVQVIYDALASGAFILSGVAPAHAVVFHGINSKGEILVVDSECMTYRLGDYKAMTYPAFLQNMAESDRHFLIVNRVTPENYFDITDDGVVSLKDVYRGACPDANSTYGVSDNGVGIDGSKNNELPENIVIPNSVNGIAVTALPRGMFMGNTKVKSIKIPSSIVEIPSLFAREAINLEEVSGTENVKVLNSNAFYMSGIKKASFPSVESLGTAKSHFMYCANLVSVELSNKITEIPYSMFKYCEKLTHIGNVENVTSVGQQAFLYARRLMNPAFLPKLTSIGVGGFAQSRVNYDWASLTNCTFGELATSLQLNPTDYWSGCTPKPCYTPLKSVLNQNDPRWADVEIGNLGYTYRTGCVTVSAAMVYSALANVNLTSPEEFVEAVYAENPDLMTADPAYGTAAQRYLEAVGLTVENKNYSAENLQTMYDALADGALVVATIHNGVDNNSAHVVVFHGVNAMGEVLVTDPGNYGYHLGAYQPLTYAIPIQNVTTPDFGFLIVTKS